MQMELESNLAVISCGALISKLLPSPLGEGPGMRGTPSGLSVRDSATNQKIPRCIYSETIRCISRMSLSSSSNSVCIKLSMCCCSSGVEKAFNCCKPLMRQKGARNLWAL